MNEKHATTNEPSDSRESEFDWRDDIADLSLEGRGYPESAAPYTRLPERFRDVVTKSVWDLSQTAIGFTARFVTDSDEVAVRWSVDPGVIPPLFFSSMFYSGVDVYARDANGVWKHKTAAVQEIETGNGELRVGWAPGEECAVYLPIRSRPKQFSIGVKKGASFLPPRPHAVAKPVVHYGTSIVNGGCASRPGLIFTSIMSRLPDVEVVNFGFSGAGKMELPMADVVAGVEASLYIVDCEWNMGVELEKTNYEPFVRRLRELRPGVPILLCGACTETPEPRATEVFSRGVFERLKAEDPAKWADLHFLSGVDMLPNDSDCTFDHCHPNDIGFAQMGRVYAEAVRKILHPQGLSRSLP